MRIVGCQVAHILKEYYLPCTRQHGRNDNRNNAGLFDRNTSSFRHHHILPDCTHILPELRFLEPHDENAQQRNDDEGHNRNRVAAHSQNKNIVKRLPHRFEVEGVAYSVPARQHDRPVAHRNDRTQHVHDKELVNTIDKERKDVACHHLAALSPIHDKPAYPPQEHRDRQPNQQGKQKPMPVRNTEIHRKYKPNLPCHRPKRHAEVQAHACVNR